MLSETSRAAHERAHTGFFEKRQLQRYAGIWSLWALGVGAVISGHFSGWNYGLAVAGWGGLLVAAAIMALMFLCLVFCIAEMSAALPDTGATYVFDEEMRRMIVGPLPDDLETHERHHELRPERLILQIGVARGDQRQKS